MIGNSRLRQNAIYLIARQDDSKNKRAACASIVMGSGGAGRLRQYQFTGWHDPECGSVAHYPCRHHKDQYKQTSDMNQLCARAKCLIATMIHLHVPNTWPVHDLAGGTVWSIVLCPLLVMQPIRQQMRRLQDPQASSSFTLHTTSVRCETAGCRQWTWGTYTRSAVRMNQTNQHLRVQSVNPRYG